MHLFYLRIVIISELPEDFFNIYKEKYTSNSKNAYK